MNLRSMSSIIAIVVIVVMATSCDSGKFKSSEDGYEYKYINKGSGEPAKNGELVFYNMKFMDEKDSIIQESTSEQPLVLQCNDEQWENMGALYKALKMLKPGDSVLIRIPTKSVYSESFRTAVPPSLDPEGQITFCMGVSKTMSEKEIVAERIKEMKKMRAEFIEANREQINSDVEVIEAYLSENDITAQSTDSGLRYVIDVEGSGDSPQAGDSVTVHYTGTLMDGTQFDSSVDKGTPFTFQLGMGQVIHGWDLGIELLKPGGKGTLYIPSPLAYGQRGSGGVIPPNAVLKFDVELLEIN